MADVKDYGELFTADILVVGGSMAGLTTAIRAKEKNPELDILVIDKGVIGWNGRRDERLGLSGERPHPVFERSGIPQAVLRGSSGQH